MKYYSDNPDLMRLVDRTDRACIGRPTDMFIPPEQPDGKELKGWPLVRHQKAAKRICWTCPAVDQCRDYAVLNHEVGVWGATNDADREAIRFNKRKEALA